MNLWHGNVIGKKSQSLKRIRCKDFHFPDGSRFLSGFSFKLESNILETDGGANKSMLDMRKREALSHQ